MKRVLSVILLLAALFTITPATVSAEMGQYGGNITGATWYWPLHGFSSEASAYSKITSSYGYRGKDGEKVYNRYHYGVDISAVMGTALYPTRKGVVWKVDNDPAGREGRSIVIDHQDGYFSVYMHLSRIDVSYGQEVGIQTQIGATGGSGNGSETAYGAHLHLGIHYGSSYSSECNVNPCPSGYTRKGNSLQEENDGFPVGTATISYSVNPTAMGMLDLNGYLGGIPLGGIEGYGTADVYINGQMVADDVSDYCIAWPVGTTYEITDIKPFEGYSYNGIENGTIRGTISEGTIDVRLNFSQIDTNVLPICEKGEVLDGRLYYFYSDPVTWYEAKRYCEALGGHLATITSAEENAFLWQFSDGGNIWLGATDIGHEGSWQWITGEPFSYSDWNTNQPDNCTDDVEGSENYLQMQAGPWNDLRGAGRLPFVCEFEGIGYLDLNGSLDGVPLGGLEDFGTADVYINGQKVADDVNDYCIAWPIGTTYKITDIKTLDGYAFHGIEQGSCQGVIGEGTVDVRLSFTKINTDTLPVCSQRAVLNGHLYYYYSEPVTWYEAKRYCEALGGHLATVSGAEENAFLWEVSNGGNIWLGATDCGHEGDWRWITGEPYDYSNWNTNQPDNALNIEEAGEHYLQMQAGPWNDNTSFARYAFVCEIEGAYLNLNGCIDGVFSEGIEGCGTADVYINGQLVADDWGDYWMAWPVGTVYEITDIKSLDGYSYDGIEKGSLQGTVGNETTEVRLIFTKKASQISASDIMARMVLKNDLRFQFGVPTSARGDWSGVYAVITKEYADREAKTVTVDIEECTVVSGMYAIEFAGVAAKEMCDTVTLDLYDADGNLISEQKVDSVMDYALRTLRKSTTSAESKSQLVDMLNYGAAAQVEFGYSTDAPANADLTEEEQALATQTVETTNHLVKGTNYKGSRLVLKNRIELQIGFANIDSICRAVYTYTNHYGDAKTVEVAGEDFISVSGLLGVSISEPVVADCRNVITVTVYDAAGEVVGYAEDNVESYVNRMSEGGDLYEAIMKFSDSSYAALH